MRTPIWLCPQMMVRVKAREIRSNTHGGRVIFATAIEVLLPANIRMLCHHSAESAIGLHAALLWGIHAVVNAVIAASAAARWSCPHGGPAFRPIWAISSI